MQNYTIQDIKRVVMPDKAKSMDLFGYLVLNNIRFNIFLLFGIYNNILFPYVKVF